MATAPWTLRPTQQADAACFLNGAAAGHCRSCMAVAWDPGAGVSVGIEARRIERDGRSGNAFERLSLSHQLRPYLDGNCMNLPFQSLLSVPGRLEFEQLGIAPALRQ